MCFGSKSNNSTPAPVPQARFDYNVADTSNDQTRKNAISASTTKTPAFGAELGTGNTAMTSSPAPNAAG